MWKVTPSGQLERSSAESSPEHDSSGFADGWPVPEISKQSSQPAPPTAFSWTVKVEPPSFETVPPYTFSSCMLMPCNLTVT